MDRSLFGVGLYTPAEAARLTGVSATRIVRWLRGHARAGKSYAPLWPRQIDLGDGHTCLGFRDLLEVRAAANFVEGGVSPQRVRRAIELATALIGDSHPLSTTRFRTDGRSIFLEVASEAGDDGASLFDLFKNQYAFRQMIEPTLRDLDFADIVPIRWFPASHKGGIVIDPTRSFGQPIDERSGVPTAVLAAAHASEGGITEAARAWCVEPGAIRRALAFESRLKRAA